MDPFSVLGVSRDASEAQVKDAFRKAALQWHPDRHVGGSAAVRALAAQKFAEVRFWAPRASPFNALKSASALPFRALTLSAQISRAYEHLTDPSRRRNGGEWRQRSSTQGAWQSHGWRERSYAGAQSAAGSGPYTWRHTDMGGARTAAEEGARQDRGRPGVVFRGLRPVALFRSAVDAQTLQQGLGRRGCRVRATRFRLGASCSVLTTLLHCRGLILVFLTVSSPLAWLMGGKATQRSGTSDGLGGSSPAARAAALAAHRPTPERLSHSAAHALGLPYRPPKLPQRSAAQLRWSATHARSAADAAEAAEAAAQRAAASAAAASDAAARARAAAQRAASADAPGEIAAADAAARSAQAHAARNEAMAEYAAALAIVEAGPRTELTPEIVYGNSTHSRRTSENEPPAQSSSASVV